MWYRLAMGDDAQVPFFETEMGKWLRTPHARSAARGYLNRVRLPEDLVDDVLQETCVKLMYAAGGVKEPDDPYRYANRALRNVTYDLGRSAKRRPKTDPIEDGDGAVEAAVETLVPDGLQDDCRRTLVPCEPGKPWVTAAALNVLTFRLNERVPVPKACPRPGAGDDDQATMWGSLWLAGKDDCFPVDGAADTPAIRQRRARAIQQIESRLRAALEAVG